MKKHRIPAGLCALTLAFSGIVCDAPAAGFVLTAYADVQSGNLGDNLTWTINEYGLLTVSERASGTTTQGSLLISRQRSRLQSFRKAS